MQENANRRAEQIRPLLRDDEAFGRLHADFHDLMEICSWFLQVANADTKKSLSRDELEDLLIDLDVNLIDHGLFHLNSLKKEVNSALEKLAEDDGEKQRRGVG